MKSKKKISKLRKFFIIIMILFLIFIIGFFLYDTYKNIKIYDGNYTTERLQSTVEAQTVESAEQNNKKIVEVINEVTQSVVGISKLKSTGNSIFSTSSEAELGLGTGFIISQDGFILSNEHVTGSKFSKCHITLDNGSTYDGTVVWSDSDIDLSITKINAKNLKSLTLGDSKNINVGESVYAVGNPIGFEFRRSVTSGIISGKNRTIKLEESAYMTDLIQTDATINPGNSGGPLIYPNGKVIGINTVKISTAEGIGFAIPINIIKTIIEKFKTTGTFEEASIGIYAYDKEVAPYIVENNVTNFEKGIYVVQITPNGPADKTELKEKDIIISVDNIELNTMNDLREYIYTKKPGDEITLKISRGKIIRNIKIQLGRR